MIPIFISPEAGAGLLALQELFATKFGRRWPVIWVACGLSGLTLLLYGMSFTMPGCFHWPNDRIEWVLAGSGVLLSALFGPTVLLAAPFVVGVLQIIAWVMQP